jgi:hypothetical protein
VRPKPDAIDACNAFDRSRASLLRLNALPVSQNFTRAGSDQENLAQVQS